MKDSKICAQCGRSFDWRKKWAKNWEQVKYCGERCRRAAKGDGATIEDTIRKLLSERDAGKTICPSEALPADLKTDAASMERVREAARRMAHAGEIEITQGGRVVDPNSFRGPIRLRKVKT